MGRGIGSFCSILHLISLAHHLLKKIRSIFNLTKKQNTQTMPVQKCSPLLLSVHFVLSRLYFQGLVVDYVASICILSSLSSIPSSIIVSIITLYKMQSTCNAYEEDSVLKFFSYPSLDMEKGIIKPVLSVNVSQSF